MNILRKDPKSADPEAMAFLNGARNYQDAANKLFSLSEGRHGSSDEPAYFLYFHTVELALKAILRAHNRPIPKGQKGHKLAKLHETVDC